MLSRQSQRLLYPLTILLVLSLASFSLISAQVVLPPPASPALIQLRAKAISWFETNLHSLHPPLDEAIFPVIIEHALQQFNQAAVSLNLGEKGLTRVDDAIKFYARGLETELEKKVNEARVVNAAQSEKECARKATILLHYYQNTPFWRNFQSTEVFDQMIWRLQHPPSLYVAPTAAPAATSTEIDSTQSSISSDRLSTIPQYVFCIGPGVNSSLVKDLFHQSRVAFQLSLRIRVAIAYLLNLVSYVLAFKASRGLKPLHEAYGNLPIAQAQALYERDVWVYAHGVVAFELWLIYRLVPDGVFFVPLHFLAVFILAASCLLGLRVQWRLAYSARTKELTLLDKQAGDIEEARQVAEKERRRTEQREKQRREEASAAAASSPSGSPGSSSSSKDSSSKKCHSSSKDKDREKDRKKDKKSSSSSHSHSKSKRGSDNV